MAELVDRGEPEKERVDAVGLYAGGDIARCRPGELLARWRGSDRDDDSSSSSLTPNALMSCPLSHDG